MRGADRALGLRNDDILSEVPYRANRAVIFSSHLYHSTGRHRFARGFESCRINLTLLYGSLAALHCSAEIAAARGAELDDGEGGPPATAVKEDL